MSKRNNNIPVNSMDDNFSHGISIDKINIKKSDFKTAQQFEAVKRSHRDEGHTFHIVEKGEVDIEIDFKKYKISAPAVVYMHPNQVHRILDFKDISVCTLAINNENLHQEYLTFLENIAPAMPLELTEEVNAIVTNIFTLCLDFSKPQNNKVYRFLLKDSCNTLVAFLISRFLPEEKSGRNLSRLEIVSQSFRELLEKYYCSFRQPGEYAKRLHISAPYLNECIRKTTGYSVSQNIQDRVILEAKRLLYHTDKSIKEIAFELGYTDYPYFTRLFSKATGMSALSFRSKSHD